MIILYVILALIVIFLAVIIIRAAMFKPKTQPSCDPDPIDFDHDKAVYNLQALVKCKTVSYRDHSLEDEAEFNKLLALLPELFPNVHKICTVTNLPDRALLYRWAGKQQGEPSVLMAHYDVVPVDENGWEKPAFEGIIENGVLWGRGTLDTKVTINGILTAAENLIANGFVPENDIYFAFSGGEEINGPGASHIVDYFEEQGITLSMVIDEGGAVVEDVFPGVKKPCAMVGIAEKGMLDLKYTVQSDGGHASAPPRHTPFGKLAIACTK
ncbi:MAG: M20/M25/M40 family metallo-hydrolase, partial [Christensenellaceae bacterium]|nr:M20/M25/M40 family metallo-hydrolase [Christensenellaceae bacterium]